MKPKFPFIPCKLDVVQLFLLPTFCWSQRLAILRRHDIDVSMTTKSCSVGSFVGWNSFRLQSLADWRYTCLSANLPVQWRDEQHRAEERTVEKEHFRPYTPSYKSKSSWNWLIGHNHSYWHYRCILKDVYFYWLNVQGCLGYDESWW